MVESENRKFQTEDKIDKGLKVGKATSFVLGGISAATYTLHDAGIVDAGSPEEARNALIRTMAGIATYIFFDSVLKSRKRLK